MKAKVSLAFKKCKAEKRPALITYTVAGHNNKINSLKIKQTHAITITATNDLMIFHLSSSK